MIENSACHLGGAGLAGTSLKLIFLETVDNEFAYCQNFLHTVFQRNVF